jgi:hypothetical protein
LIKAIESHELSFPGLSELHEEISNS